MFKKINLTKIKRFYLGCIEKDQKNIREWIFYIFLYLLSFVYGAVVIVRNLLYNLSVLPSYRSKKKVISIGNISWAGSGKTSVAMILYKYFSANAITAVITKGYAKDEYLLLKEKCKYVYDRKNRISLIKELENDFDIFILDDGFQHRKLKRDINLVLMGAREFEKKTPLIPASFFREGFASLNRADIVILTYGDDFKDIEKTKNELYKFNKDLSIYTAEYKFKEIVSCGNKVFSLKQFDGKKVAALTAIGYPQGFISLLEEQGVDIEKEIIFPDHHNFTSNDMAKIEDDLEKNDIKDIFITRKDFYHIDFSNTRLNYFIVDVELDINNLDELFNDLEVILFREEN